MSKPGGKPAALLEGIETAIEACAAGLRMDAAINERDDRERAIGIVNRLSEDARMKDVWRELIKRKQGDLDTQFFYGRSDTDAERITAAVKLFHSACMAAVWGFKTEITSTLDSKHQARVEQAQAIREWALDLGDLALERANELREPPDYRLRVDRTRSDPMLKGYVITISALCASMFGVAMPSAVSSIASVALQQLITGAQVRELLKSA